MAGKPALCPSFPSCKKGLEGPDAVRTLATRHGILIGDGSVHAAGPMRGHGQSRLSDTCSDLVVPLFVSVILGATPIEPRRRTYGG
jgi:hypothetical protein